MSNERGRPEGATGAQGAGEQADGVSSNGSSAAAEPAEAASKKRRMSGWRELPVLIVVALTIALVIKSFVVQAFWIPTSSMEDTLMAPSDRVLVSKLVYHFRSIQPGDIIVFNGDGSWNPNPPAEPPSSILVRAYDDTLGWLFHQIGGLFGTPADPVNFIKRVIGTPGDRVVCCNAQGLVTVNGVPLHESSYLYPGAAPSQIRFNIVVPPGRLWVMGDNRQISDDSRLRMSDPGGGTIPENKVIGRAFVVIWPPSHWKILSIPFDVQSARHQRGSCGAGPRAGLGQGRREPGAGRSCGARAAVRAARSGRCRRRSADVAAAADQTPAAGPTLRGRLPGAGDGNRRLGDRAGQRLPTASSSSGHDQSPGTSHPSDPRGATGRASRNRSEADLVDLLVMATHFRLQVTTTHLELGLPVRT